jgi:hypothetical protein
MKCFLRLVTQIIYLFFSYQLFSIIECRFKGIIKKYTKVLTVWETLNSRNIHIINQAIFNQKKSAQSTHSQLPRCDWVTRLQYKLITILVKQASKQIIVKTYWNLNLISLLTSTLCCFENVKMISWWWRWCCVWRVLAWTISHIFIMHQTTQNEVVQFIFFILFFTSFTWQRWRRLTILFFVDHQSKLNKA